MEIAFAFQLEIEHAVLRKKLKHVIEKADAGRDGILSAPVYLQRDRDVRLFGFALDRCAAHSVLFLEEKIRTFIRTSRR